MNKQGIVSAYALLLLQLLLMVIVLTIQTCTTFTTLHKQQDEELIDVAILHSIQGRLSLYKEEATRKQEEVNNNHEPDAIEESHDSEHSIAQEPTQEEEGDRDAWKLLYKGIRIEFDREQEHISIQYELAGKRIFSEATLDESKQHLMNYEYL